jgi:hypothetical protein
MQSSLYDIAFLLSLTKYMLNTFKVAFALKLCYFTKYD